ncbi:mucin-associated surface protein (MASP), putative, partial [Trypanosoma cruzi marinkellei]
GGAGCAGGSSGASSNLPSNSNGNDVSKITNGTSLSTIRASPENGEKSQPKVLAGKTLTDKQALEGSNPNSQPNGSNTHEASDSLVTTGDSTKTKGAKSVVAVEGPSSTLPLTAGDSSIVTQTPESKKQAEQPPETPVSSAEERLRVPAVPAVEGNITTSNPSQESREQTTKKESEALKQVSEDTERGQQNQDTAPSTLVGVTGNGSRAETTASSTSTNDGDGAQSTGDENNDNAQRPNPKETNHLKADNTNVAPTFTEAAPQTATTATTTQTNDTSTKGDSDGSTAVSHTTSPLLLLVVACAAAAVVAA